MQYHIFAQNMSLFIVKERTKYNLCSEHFYYNFTQIKLWKMERKKFKVHVPQVSRTPLLIEVRQLHEVCRTTISTEKIRKKKET